MPGAGVAERTSSVTGPRWLPCAAPTALVWVSGYGALQLWWARGHRPSFGALGTDLMVVTGPAMVAVCGVAVIVAAVLVGAGPCRPVELAGWLISAVLVVACPAAPARRRRPLASRVGDSVRRDGLRQPRRLLRQRGPARRGRSSASATGRGGVPVVRSTWRPAWSDRLARARMGDGRGDGECSLQSGPDRCTGRRGFRWRGRLRPHDGRLRRRVPAGRAGTSARVGTSVGSAAPTTRTPGAGCRALPRPAGLLRRGARTAHRRTIEGTAHREPSPLVFVWVSLSAYWLWGLGLGAAALSYARCTRRPCRHCGR